MSTKLRPDKGTVAEQIAKKHFPCTCGEIYLSRKLTAPDCPYHALDWEAAMEEYAQQFTTHATTMKSKEDLIKIRDEQVEEYSFQVPYNGTNDFYNEAKAKAFTDGWDACMEQFTTPVHPPHTEAWHWVKASERLPIAKGDLAGVIFRHIKTDSKVLSICLDMTPNIPALLNDLDKWEWLEKRPVAALPDAVGDDWNLTEAKVEMGNKVANEAFVEVDKEFTQVEMIPRSVAFSIANRFYGSDYPMQRKTFDDAAKELGY